MCRMAWCVQAAGYLAVGVGGEPGPPRHPPHSPPLLQAEAHPPRPALTCQYTQILIHKQGQPLSNSMKIGYSDCHNLMEFTNKKMPNTVILCIKNVC
jgi:hypothetical protein